MSSSPLTFADFVAQTPESIREQILAKIEEILAIEGLTVHRERTRPIDQDDLPAILVYSEDDEPTPIGSVYGADLVQRHLEIALELRAMGSETVPPDKALDPLIVYATTRLYSDPKLGGLANGVTEGRTSWTSKYSGVPLAAARLSFKVHYRTSRLDPTSTL